MNQFASSDKLDALLPPPVQLQKRAHECATALVCHRGLMQCERNTVRNCCERKPDALGWADIRRMFRIYRDIFRTAPP